MSNNPPYVEISLTKEEYDFLLNNCETNIGQGLNILMEVQKGNFPQSVAEKVIGLNENFKAIRDKLKKATL